MDRLLAALSRPLPAAGFLAALTALVLILVPAGASSDLQAMWLAGAHFARGDLANIYPPESALFIMTPPPAWVTRDGAPVYPFLYPPLWAALAGALAQITSFETVAATARFANAAMLVGCGALAWRVTGSRLPAPVFTALAALALTQTFVGSLALLENQPQIAVSFLILLALDRDRANAPAAAGIALAIAAALKVYPLLFALLWIATRRWHSLAAFTLVGAALGLSSIALAGWPLHETFLQGLRTISATALLTPVSWALTPLLTQLFDAGALTYQPSPAGGGWLVAPLAPAGALLRSLALAAALILIARAMARADADTRGAALWPLALLTVSLLGPLAWSYHYIPAVACLPALADRFGPRAATAIGLAILIPLAPPVVALYLNTGPLPSAAQAAGTVAMTALAVAFATAALRPTRQITPRHNAA